VYLKKDKTYIPFNVSNDSYEKDSYALYKAISTGNKIGLKKDIIHIFKKYGFIHLLTPSGIHLSSILFLFKFSVLFELGSLILCFFLISKYQSYFSLERVIMFRISQNLIKISPIKNFSIETYFVMTLVLSFIFGHYTESHMSYIYSAIFWGTIIIFRKNKFKLILYLNISLFFISSLNSQETSPLSILINPIITGIISAVFPALFINQIIPKLISPDFLINYFFKFFIKLIKLLNSIDPFPLIYIGTFLILIFIICIYLRRFKLGILLLCLNTTGISKSKHTNLSNSIINLGDKTEIIYQKKNWIHFIDQKCKIEEFDIFCKKKPSKLGGPIF
jgi:competence protein ComEC